MAKKLTSAKAKEILHDKEVHGHPLTDKQRKFFGAIAGGAKPYKAQDGGWLDKYEQGGLVLKQKTKDNYDLKPNANEYQVTLPPGFVGMGNNLQGRNYSPAWGGQFQNGGILQPPMAGADTSVPMYQMGGSMPGAVGFMYARTQSPAPSNGLYAKKTKASAQNGREMSYYQHGLDFTPKTISQDGSRTPIVVTDPKDPRLKAYQDSLNLYNSYKYRDNLYKKLATKYNLKTWKDNNAINPNAKIQPISSQGFIFAGGDSNINGDDISDFLITKDNKEVLIMSDSPEISNIFKGSGRQYGANLHGYKKPVQPVEYRAPQRDTLYVSDPNDPRLKAYQDSLSLYKGYRNYDLDKTKPIEFYDKNDMAILRAMYPNTELIERKPTPLSSYDQWVLTQSGRKTNFKVGKTYSNKELALEQNKAEQYANRQGRGLMKNKGNLILDWNNQAVRSSTIAPIGMGYGDMKDIDNWNAGLVTIYKKPVQPIVLEEEPRFEKPIPIPRDTRDLGYTLPAPGQPTAPELYKYSPDTPTKFSFTSPTGKYNEQKTIYFPSKSALKSFTEGVRGATYQEGADYATATGNLQDGGIVKDDMGYWNPENWGKVVEIDSNDITMQGVDRPLIGISDAGDVKKMKPGKNYKFKGTKVREYPIGKKGVSVNKADENPNQKLDQLFNFTNYNKPTNGGWLDKYK